MGKHAGPRHAQPRGPAHVRPRGLIHALTRTVAPIVVASAVGVLAIIAPELRGEPPVVDGSFSAADVSPEVESTDSREQEPTRQRTRGPKIGGGVQAVIEPTVFKRKPEPVAPANYVRVPRSATQSTAFTVSSFNVLGFGHTVSGGNKKGYADGHTRIRWTAGLLRARNVSVAGFQEFQVQQANTFNAVAGGEYAVYPGAAGGQQAVQNSIVWRRADWELVEAHTTEIPYFNGTMPMPHILLRNLHTGRHVWFANYHNPADAHGPAEGKRDAATGIEIALFNRLRSETGYPVVVTGDMNEREDYLCRVAAGAAMHSADGGYYSGGCHLPGRMNVDWILGTGELTFDGYVADRSSAVNRVSDHPLVVSGATVAPAYSTEECVAHPKRSDVLLCPPA